MIIDCAIYRSGRRESVELDSATLRSALDSLDRGDFVWIGMYMPTSDEMAQVAGPLKLHPLAIEDALNAHQRPKIEQYDDHLFMSLRTVHYETDNIETGELNLFLSERYLLTVRHRDEHDLRKIRQRAEQQMTELRGGPIAALYSVVDAVVDHYEDVALELEADVEEVEEAIFASDRLADSARIYRLKRETLEFRRAVWPLREPVNRLMSEPELEASLPYFRDIADHLARVSESIDNTQSLLDNALNAHLAQLSLQQNDDMRKLAAGATLFAVPTAIAGIYGMNFHWMPELTWKYSYPIVLLVMLTLCAGIYWRFKKSGWL